jgi:hypothetical protein
LEALCRKKIAEEFVKRLKNPTWASNLAGSQPSICAAALSAGIFMMSGPG